MKTNNSIRLGMLRVWAFAVLVQAVVAPISPQSVSLNRKHATIQLLSIEVGEIWRGNGIEGLVVESGFQNRGGFVIRLPLQKVQESNLCYRVAIMLEEAIVNSGYFEINYSKLLGYANVIISSQLKIVNSGRMSLELSGFYSALAIDLGTYVPAVFDILLVASVLIVNSGRILVKSTRDRPALVGLVSRDGTHASFYNPGVVCLSHASLIQQMPISKGGCIALASASWLVLNSSYVFDEGTVVYCATIGSVSSTVVLQYLEDDTPTVTRFKMIGFGSLCGLEVRPPLGQFVYANEVLKYHDLRGRVRLEVKIGDGFSSGRFVFTPGSAVYPLQKKYYRPSQCICT